MLNYHEVMTILIALGVARNAAVLGFLACGGGNDDE